MQVTQHPARPYAAPPEGQYTVRNLTLQKVAKIGMLLATGILLTPLVLLAASVATPFTAILLTTIAVTILTTAAICHRTLKNLDRKDASDNQMATYNVLFKAVAQNDKFKVKLLLACGANPNTTYEGDNPLYIAGDTLLHITARTGNTELLTKLLRTGANRNAQNTNLWTPLHEAISNDQERCVEILKQWGAKREIQGRVKKNVNFSTLMTPLELSGNLLNSLSINDAKYNTRFRIYKMIEVPQ